MRLFGGQLYAGRLFAGRLFRGPSAPVEVSESGGKRKRAPGWARADVSARDVRRLRDEDDLLLILLAGALQAGLLE